MLEEEFHEWSQGAAALLDLPSAGTPHNHPATSHLERELNKVRSSVECTMRTALLRGTKGVREDVPALENMDRELAQQVTDWVQARPAALQGCAKAEMPK